MFRSQNFQILFLILSFCPGAFSSTDSPLKADTLHKINLLRRTSQFAPIKTKIWDKQWKKNIPVQGILQLPPDFPGRDQIRKAWRVNCLREFLDERERYKRSRKGRFLFFRGNSSTTYREVRFQEEEHSATFRRHDGSIIHEAYFKIGSDQFRPLRKFIVYSYREREQRLSMEWEVRFLNFQTVTKEPESLQQLLPKPWVNPKKTYALPFSISQE